jgi:hypothetical protein
MDIHHGKPEDGMQSDNETEENTRPGLGLSAATMASLGLQPQGQKVGAKEAAGTATDVAAKMAGVGRSTGSTLKSSKNVFN